VPPLGRHLHLCSFETLSLWLLGRRRCVPDIGWTGAERVPMCWSKSPQPFELSFRGRIEDEIATVELVRA
jgi:hypothetical protein